MLYNDRAITQNTPKCVENFSDDHYYIFVRLLITSFSVSLIITLKTVCFLSDIGQTLVCINRDQY